ncbi:MAG: hypothetical protein QXG62_04090 [Saccharolobus sp.]
MNGVIVLLLLVATVALSLSVLSIYFSFFSTIDSSLNNQENVITISKLVQIQVSTPSFSGTPASGYNVSYLIFISAPVSKLSIIPFVTYPMNYSSLYYYLPQQQQNASLFYSNLNGYIPLNRFIISDNVYLPQGGQFLGKINSIAFNITSNQTYILSAKLKQNQIIVIWILYNYQGKWYRIGYTYINPFNQGVGSYVLASSGIYSSNSKTSLNHAQSPHFAVSQTGFGFGLWFEPVINSTTRSLILNLTLIPVGSNNNNITVLIYQQNLKLYVNITQTGNKQQTQTFQTFLYNLNGGQYYFINISHGSQVNLPNQFNITLYSASGKLLNTTTTGKLLNTTTNNIGQTNGYNISVTFGSSSLANIIFQAYLVTPQSNSGITQFYNVSTLMLNNGPFYNNTLNYYKIISTSQNLYGIGYWYFVWPNSNPPSQIPGIFWYWPTGSYSLQTYYIPEIGQNTYILV